jgi:hypothetical protein
MVALLSCQRAEWPPSTAIPTPHHATLDRDPLVVSSHSYSFAIVTLGVALHPFRHADNTPPQISMVMFQLLDSLTVGCDPSCVSHALLSSWLFLTPLIATDPPSLNGPTALGHPTHGVMPSHVVFFAGKDGRARLRPLHGALSRRHTMMVTAAVGYSLSSLSSVVTGCWVSVTLWSLCSLWFFRIIVVMVVTGMQM